MKTHHSETTIINPGACYSPIYTSTELMSDHIFNSVTNMYELMVDNCELIALLNHHSVTHYYHQII